MTLNSEFFNCCNSDWIYLCIDEGKIGVKYLKLLVGFFEDDGIAFNFDDFLGIDLGVVIKETLVIFIPCIVNYTT
jgi:hypothetical protein